MTTPFLTAHWTSLLSLSYAVPEAALAPYLPPHLELDRWEGRAYVSIVAFDFSHTHIMGIGIPNLFNLRDFPELNLRFYVREGNRRGVIFIREIVPSPVVAGLARLTYNEPYAAARLESHIKPDGTGGRVFRHDLIWRGMPQAVSVTVNGPAEAPAPGGFAPWVIDLPWGFGKTHRGRPTRFRVAHPDWRTYPVTGHEITLDFAALYGARWGFLKGRAPDSVVLAEGSPVTVYINEPAGSN